MAEEQGKSKYDWGTLKKEFFNSDILEATAFIRSKLGMSNEEILSNGNIRKNIAGWTEEKKEFKEQLVEEAKKEMIEKLKIEVQDLLLTKKMSYELMRRYIEYYAKILAKKEIPQEEKDFIAQFSMKTVDAINKWIQLELGLPTNIAQLQGSKEKPINILTLIRKADEILKEEDVKRTGNQKDTPGNSH